MSWIEPSGKIHKKRAKNRKIGYKSHGHTMLRGSIWETNFENEFQSADDGVHEVVASLLNMKPLGKTPAEFFLMVKLRFKQDVSLRDTCKFYHIDEEIHRKLLLLLLSLLIRSPSYRSKYEGMPKLIGLLPSENVGKANMDQSYKIAKKLCETGFTSNQYFIIIHSPFKKFIYGDGNLDWLTSGIVANRIDGRILIPLTPHLCIFFCTPRFMASTPNCASITATFWMVDWINDIVQIYSRDKLFFLGKSPVLKETFKRGQFLEHQQRSDKLIEMLDEVAGIKQSSGIVQTGWN